MKKSMIKVKKPKVAQSMKRAYRIYGKAKLADALKIRYQSINRWVETGKLPLTEFSGDTQYSRNIERLTDGAVTIEDLLGWRPVTQTDRWPENA